MVMDKFDEQLKLAVTDMPQFDVPESLTQSILSSVAQEEGSRRGLLADFGWAVCGACVLLALLYLDSAESVDGLISWCVGGAGVVMIQVLLIISRQVATSR